MVLIHIYTTLSARGWFVSLNCILTDNKPFMSVYKCPTGFEVNQMDKTFPLSIYYYYTQILYTDQVKNILVEWDMILFIFVCMNYNDRLNEYSSIVGDSD